MVTLNISAHAVHKAGNQPEHYEDAYAFDTVTGRAAVADGASDSFEARDWASTLTQSFVKTPPEPTREAFMEWLHLPSRAWNIVLPWDDLPWYAEQKARDVGGLATLIGFYLMPEEKKNAKKNNDTLWRALAVGDACLLHIRDNKLLVRFPIETTDGFDTTPTLLCTRLEQNEFIIDDDELHTCEGTCRPGDIFLLASDAIAERLYQLADLEELNVGLPDWESILTLVNEDFEGLIGQFRDDGLIRNDDVTLLVVHVVEEEEAV